MSPGWSKETVMTLVFGVLMALLAVCGVRKRRLVRSICRRIWRNARMFWVREGKRCFSSAERSS